MIGNFTHTWEHVNENAWRNNVQVAFLVTNCTVLLVTFFVGIVANLFVTYAVYHQKSLQTSTNALLVNLALIDLVRCATDCPLLLVVILSGDNTRDLGDLLCDGQMMSFSLSCCVQLFTLASISAERHQAIANPFKTAERRKRVMVWIPLTWAVAIVVSVVCVMFTKDSPVYVRCRALRLDALKTYDSFGLYVLLPVWSMCLALIVGFYSRIFVLVKVHNRKIFDKGVFPPPDTKVQEDKKKEQEVVETKVTIVTEPVAPKKIDDTHLIREVNGSAGGTKSCNGDLEVQTTLNTSTVAESQPFTKDTNTMDVKTEGRLDHSNQQCVTLASELIDLENGGEDPGDAPKAAEKPSSEQVPPTADGAQTASADETVEVMGAVCMMPSFANKDRGNKKKEGKLAKRSGYIILTFLVFWMPLMGTVLLNTSLNRNQSPDMELIQELEVLVVSIACMTSLTNPIIYAVVNPQFRTEFYSLKARCKALWAKS